MNTTNTVTLNIGPKKSAGWCEANGIDHSWKSGPTLTCDPPILTRECVNCGKRQYFQPGAWQDAP